MLLWVLGSSLLVCGRLCTVVWMNFIRMAPQTAVIRRRCAGLWQVAYQCAVGEGGYFFSGPPMTVMLI